MPRVSCIFPYYCLTAELLFSGGGWYVDAPATWP